MRLSIIFLFCIFIFCTCELVDPNGLIQPSDVVNLEFDSTKILYANGEDQIELKARLKVIPPEPQQITFRTSYGTFLPTGVENLTSDGQVATVYTGIVENGTAVVYLRADSTPRESVEISASIEGYSAFGRLSFIERTITAEQVISLSLLEGSEVVADGDATIRLSVELLEQADLNEGIVFATEQGSFLNLNAGELMNDGRYKVIPNGQRQFDVFLQSDLNPNNEVKITASQKGISDIVSVDFLPSYPSMGLNFLSSTKDTVLANGQDFATIQLNVNRTNPNESVSNNLIVRFEVIPLDISMAIAEMNPPVSVLNNESSTSNLKSINGQPGVVEVKSWIEGWEGGDTLRRVVIFK